jgi:hypothetical protein
MPQDGCPPSCPLAAARRKLLLSALQTRPIDDVDNPLLSPILGRDQRVPFARCRTEDSTVPHRMVVMDPLPGMTRQTDAFLRDPS